MGLRATVNLSLDVYLVLSLMEFKSSLLVFIDNEEWDC